MVNKSDKQEFDEVKHLLNKINTWYAQESIYIRGT